MTVCEECGRLFDPKEYKLKMFTSLCSKCEARVCRGEYEQVMRDKEKELDVLCNIYNSEVKKV